MTRQKMREGITKEPFVRFKSSTRRRRDKDGSWIGRRSNIELWFNVGTVRHCRLVKGERVDLLYDRYNEIWQRPILIIKKSGSQRKLSGPTSGVWLHIGIGAAVKQWGLPLLLGRRLDVLDYIHSTGEIYIDISDVEGFKRLHEEKKKKKEKLTEQMAYAIGKDNGYVFKTTKTMREKMKIASKREDRPVNQIIINALEIYLEENHNDLC